MNLPGPPNRFWGLQHARRLRSQPVEFLRWLGDTYGELAAFRLGPHRAILVNHPDLIRDVMLTHRESFPKLPLHTNVVRSIDGASIFVREGEDWERQRRLIQPAFQNERLARYSQAMASPIMRCLDDWPANSALDLADTMVVIALRVITRVLLGPGTEADLHQLAHLVELRSEVFVKEMAAALQVPDWMPLPNKRKKKWVYRTMQTWIRNAIRNAQEVGSLGDDILSVLLRSNHGRVLSEQEMVDLVVMLFQAGVDDIASALMWSCVTLAAHPQAQSELADEIRQSVGRETAPLNRLDAVEALDRFVMETLRLYPPSWLFAARQAKEAIALGDHTVPAGSWIFVCPFVTHRSPAYFPDPDDFLPERFQGGPPPKFAYFPFGAGPRMCTGSGLAMAELKTILAMMLQRFEIKVDGSEQIRPIGKVTLRPPPGVKLVLARRT